MRVKRRSLILHFNQQQGLRKGPAHRPLRFEKRLCRFHPSRRTCRDHGHTHVVPVKAAEAAVGSREIANENHESSYGDATSLQITCFQSLAYSLRKMPGATV